MAFASEVSIDSAKAPSMRANASSCPLASTIEMHWGTFISVAFAIAAFRSLNAPSCVSLSAGVVSGMVAPVTIGAQGVSPGRRWQCAGLHRCVERTGKQYRSGAAARGARADVFNNDHVDSALAKQEIACRRSSSRREYRPRRKNTIAKQIYEPDDAFLFEMTLDATSLC